MEATESVNWLLEQDPSVALQWLYEILEGVHPPLPQELDWLLLAECAASNTFRRSENASFPNGGWAKVAVLAYSYVISEEKHSTRLAHNPDMKKFSYLSCEVALMSIQARCILAFGHVAGDPVLDVNHLLQCFFDDVPFSPEDVLKKYAGERKELTPKERRELMRIRKKLQILRLLEKEQMLPSRQELLAWFAVWDQTHF